MIRAWVVPVLGNVTACEPSLGVLPSRVLQLAPPSVESRMATLVQFTPLPVHFSWISQSETTARHTVVGLAKDSSGQAGPEPLQASATSQMPPAGRQTLADGTNESAGQVVLVPEQLS